jgi:formylglycine-generating enzyme
VKTRQVTWRTWVAGSIGLALLVMTGVALAIMLKGKSPDGTLVVDVNKSDSEIYVNGGRVAVSRGEDGKTAEIRAAPGTLKVEVKKDGFTPYAEEVTLAKGERRVLLVRLVPASPSRDETLPRPEPLDDSGPTASAAADIRRVRETWAKYLGRKVEETVDAGHGTTITFVLVPPGKFRMGSPTGEKGHEANEVQHEVTLTRPFYLAAHAVTRGQFRRFAEETGYATDAESDRRGGFGWDTATGSLKQDPKYTWRSPSFQQTDEHPVVTVSWNDAMKYAEWLGKKDGWVHRLPTEAEWEYACRAGTRTPFFFGSDENDMIHFGNAADASFRRVTGKNWGIRADDGYGFTAPAGRFRPNGFGLYDMHGNVWQWCADGPREYSQMPVTDPTGSLGAGNRVLRGGSWYSDPPIARSAHRFWNPQDARFDDYGIRLVLDPSAGK